MFAFADAWAFLKADDSDKARGMYREATIPFDKRKPVTRYQETLKNVHSLTALVVLQYHKHLLIWVNL